jgi:surface antigen
MKKAICGIAAMAMLAACTGTNGYVSAPNQTIGTVAGAVAGGVIGNQIGGGRGNTVATAVGIVAGGLIGNQIGASLDQQNQARAQQAEYRALQTGQTTYWRDPAGKPYYGEVVPGRTYQNATNTCREYTHTVYINGQPEVLTGNACRRSDGTWAPV